jgi:hypothetical protein
MKTEYRIIFTATFNTVTERDKAYTALKLKVTELRDSALFKRADMTKDEYPVPDVETSTEKVI